jgi:hypothetical protein
MLNIVVSVSIGAIIVFLWLH